MKGEIITIAVDGTVSRCSLNSTNHLPELNRAVGGDIGFVSGFSSFEGRDCDAYINDNGLLDGLPKNETATRLWQEQLAPGFVPELAKLHGPLAIVTGDADFMAESRC